MTASDRHHSYTAKEKSEAWLWLKEFALRPDSPHHAAVAILEWTELKEAETRHAGPLGGDNMGARAGFSQGAPISGSTPDAPASVGPWKECVYKHQDGPVDKARAYDWLTKMWPLEITRLAQASTPWEKPTSSEVHRAIKMAMESSPPATALPVKEG